MYLCIFALNIIEVLCVTLYARDSVSLQRSVKLSTVSCRWPF